MNRKEEIEKLEEMLEEFKRIPSYRVFKWLKLSCQMKEQLALIRSLK